MEADVDILDGEILREVQQSTLRIMQLLSKFIQWPTTQLILLDQIDEELDTIRVAGRGCQQGTGPNTDESQDARAATTPSQSHSEL